MKRLERLGFKVFIQLYFWLKKPKRDHSKKPRLFWGTVPILNFKYWNEAMKGAGFYSRSIMTDFYSINKKEDFDAYLNDIPIPKYIKPIYFFYRRFPNLSRIYMMFYIADNFDIVNLSYEGAVFKDTDYWKMELEFYKKAGMKIVGLPYGGDYQMYSRLYNKSWHHALLVGYPKNALREKTITEKVEFFVYNADCIMAGFQFDQIGRWDILPYALYPMNCSLWKPKTHYSNHDGTNGVVKVYHTPNHKTIKGTEFVIEAVEELKNEGLKIELVLLQNVPNDKVRELLHDDADILIEQLILGYALSAIEGMSTGLPVITNLEEENETRVFRRFSYLNECPMLSSNPEKIKKDLKTLITNPELRKKLGEAGVKYAEKYHSYTAMAEFFTAIYDKIWFNKEIDLINFFNPHVKDSYNNRKEKVVHPLVENKYIVNN